MRQNKSKCHYKTTFLNYLFLLVIIRLFFFLDRLFSFLNVLHSSFNCLLLFIVLLSVEDLLIGHTEDFVHIAKHEIYFYTSKIFAS